jgi:hypothetical protein
MVGGGRTGELSIRANTRLFDTPSLQTKEVIRLEDTGFTVSVSLGTGGEGAAAAQAPSPLPTHIGGIMMPV